MKHKLGQIIAISVVTLLSLTALHVKSTFAKISIPESQYIIVLKDSEKDAPGIAKKMSSDYGIKTKFIYKRVLNGFSATIPSDKLEKVRSDMKVKYVAKDRILNIDAKKEKPTVTPTLIPTPTNTPLPTITNIPTPTSTITPMFVRIVTPNGGETLQRGQNYRITWDSSSQIDMVTLGYKSCDSCLSWIAYNIPNNGYYDWIVNVGNTTNTQFKIYILAYDTGVGSVSDTSDNNFTVLQTTLTPTLVPTSTPTPSSAIWIKIKSPNGGEILNTGENYNITWDSDPRIDKVTIGYKACPSCLDWIAYTASNSGSYTWNVSTAYATSQYLIEILGYWTGYGSTSDESDNYFTVNKPSITPTSIPTTTLTPTPLPIGQIIPLGLKRIGVNDVGGTQAQGGGGDSVAVLDTGVDLTHPDLAAGILASVDCLSGICINGGNDDNGHGTHVAGTIAALDNDFGVVGVRPSSRIVSVKILDKNGSGYLSNIIAGIDWITFNSQNYLIKVVNMSLGGFGSSDNNCGNSNNDPLHQAICASVSSGITYVVSAGNDSSDMAYHVPASYNDAVITVSALVDTDGKPGALGGSTSYGSDDTFATFSNFGSAVDFGAPGVNVYSTVKGGIYGNKSGTSMASPHVAGVAARYINSYPGSNWQQVLNGLKGIAEPLNSGHTDPSGNHPEPVIQAAGL